MPQSVLLAAYYREDVLMSKNVLFHSCLDFILFFCPFQTQMTSILMFVMWKNGLFEKYVNFLFQF